jgi:hypothetical protein
VDERAALRKPDAEEEEEEEEEEWLMAVAELQPSTQSVEEPAAAGRRRAVDALSPYAWQVVPQYSGSPREVKRKCGVCGEPKFGTHGPSGCPLVCVCVCYTPLPPPTPLPGVRESYTHKRVSQQLPSGPVVSGATPSRALTRSRTRAPPGGDVEFVLVHN